MVCNDFVGAVFSEEKPIAKDVVQSSGWCGRNVAHGKEAEGAEALRVVDGQSRIQTGSPSPMI